MSLKDDMKMVKDELNSEEKFFEKAVITEKFVKKYKKLMIGSVLAIVIFVAGDIAYNINEQSRIDSANQALLEIQKNPDNQTTLARLKSLSPALYDVWLYSEAVKKGDVESLKKLKSSKDELIKNLASYEVAQASKDLNLLEAYSSKQESIYRDLAQLQAAVILMNEDRVDEAHQKLSMINIQSPLSKVAKALMHYGVK